MLRAKTLLDLRSPVLIRYKGKPRRVEILSIFYGRHPEYPDKEQWLLHTIEPGLTPQYRTFPFADIEPWDREKHGDPYSEADPRT